MRLSRMTWRLLFAAATVGQLVALYWPVQLDEGTLLPGSDKLVHFGIFAAATFTALLAGLPRWWVLALFLLHAPLSEVIQGTLLNRDLSIFDVVADVIGALAGVWLALSIRARIVEDVHRLVAETSVGRED